MAENCHESRRTRRDVAQRLSNDERIIRLIEKVHQIIESMISEAARCLDVLEETIQPESTDR